MRPNIEWECHWELWTERWEKMLGTLNLVWFNTTTKFPLDNFIGQEFWNWTVAMWTGIAMYTSWFLLWMALAYQNYRVETFMWICVIFNSSAWWFVVRNSPSVRLALVKCSDIYLCLQFRWYVQNATIFQTSMKIWWI